MNNRAVARDIRPPAGAVEAGIGRRIREARLARGMSLAQVGGQDLTRSFLSLVERGRSRISVRALEIVADRLELPLSYFLGEDPVGAAMRAELGCDQAEIALVEGRPQDALRLVEEVEAAGAEACRASLLRARALLVLGRRQAAESVLRGAISHCETGHDEGLIAGMLYELGGILYAAAAYDEALGHFRRALDLLASGTEDGLLSGRLSIYIGHILYVRGDVDGAINHYRRADELFRPLGQLGALGSMYAGLSRAYHRKNELRAALRYSKMSVAAFQAHQNLALAARELNNVAVRYQELGDLDQAEQHAREAAGRAEQIGDRESESLSRSTLASILLQKGDLRGAQNEADAAVDLAECDTDLGRIDGWSVSARIAERDGDLGRADSLYRRILDTLRPTDQRIRYADAALAYSMVLKGRGEIELALDLAVEAAQLKSAQPA